LKFGRARRSHIFTLSLKVLKYELRGEIYDRNAFPKGYKLQFGEDVIYGAKAHCERVTGEQFECERLELLVKRTPEEAIKWQRTDNIPRSP
jgi:hypothetical protein